MVTLYARIHTVLCSPIDFIQRPVLWADMIAQYRATFTCGPNFAFGLLLKRLQQQKATADWSTMRCICFGGEPTEASMVTRLQTTLRVRPKCTPELEP